MNQAQDFLGKILSLLFERVLEEDSMRERVRTWNMIVVLDTDYYPLTITFQDGITVTYGSHNAPTIVVETNVATIVDVLTGSTSMIKAILSRRIRIQGMLRHLRSTYRYYSLLGAIIKG